MSLAEKCSLSPKHVTAEVAGNSLWNALRPYYRPTQKGNLRRIAKFHLDFQFRKLIDFFGTSEPIVRFIL